VGAAAPLGAMSTVRRASTEPLRTPLGRRGGDSFHPRAGAVDPPAPAGLREIASDQGPSPAVARRSDGRREARPSEQAPSVGPAHRVRESLAACNDRAVSEDAVSRAKELRVTWRDVDSVPVHAANQFLAQFDAVGDRPEQMILAVGQLTPPVVLGTAEQKLAQLEQISEIPVITLARYSITPARITELIDLLTQMKTVFQEGMIPVGEGMPRGNNDRPE
jgi:hypothetical protein